MNRASLPPKDSLSLVHHHDVYSSSWELYSDANRIIDWHLVLAKEPNRPSKIVDLNRKLGPCPTGMHLSGSLISPLDRRNNKEAAAESISVGSLRNYSTGSLPKAVGRDC